MFFQIFNIFTDVVTPVYLLVLLGYIAGPRLDLDPRTLSRTAYFIFVPAFTFDLISTSTIDFISVTRMASYALVVHVLLAAVGFVVAKLLGRSKEMVAGYVMIATFGNVGNFGLSLNIFHFGDAAKASATVYFLVIMFVSFVICVGISSWTQNGSFRAVASVLKTPALLAIIPAAAFVSSDTEVPLFLARTTGLLGAAMIPTMLFVLGVQLAVAEKPKISMDVILASGIRLLLGPAIAAAIAIPFGLSGLELGTGIIQASMPAAVLVSIIAIEYRVMPSFVTTSVLFSTLASLFTLTFLLYLV